MSKLLLTYTDTDWAVSPSDWLFTSGYCIIVGKVWCLEKKQNVVARSSAGVEYQGMAIATYELIWIKLRKNWNLEKSAKWNLCLIIKMHFTLHQIQCFIRGPVKIWILSLTQLQRLAQREENCSSHIKSPRFPHPTDEGINRTKTHGNWSSKVHETLSKVH